MWPGYEGKRQCILYSALSFNYVKNVISDISIIRGIVCSHLDLLERSKDSVGWLGGSNSEHGIGVKCLLELASAVFCQELPGWTGAWA